MWFHKNTRIIKTSLRCVLHKTSSNYEIIFFCIIKCPYLKSKKKRHIQHLLFLSFHGLFNEEHNQILIRLRCNLRISSPTPQAWGSWSWGLHRKAVTIFTCLSNWEHCLAAHSGLLDKCVQYSLISWWDIGQSILRMWTEWKPRETVGLSAADFIVSRLTMNRGFVPLDFLSFPSCNNYQDLLINKLNHSVLHGLYSTCFQTFFYYLKWREGGELAWISLW